MAIVSSLAARSMLAIGLLMGFYALGLSIALALLWIPYAEIVHLHRVHLKLTVLAVVSAGAILWALVPRRDRFEPPGPVVRDEDAPKLHALVKEVATATGQAVPADVYLIPDVNAWVAERGGVGGVGSRRVMGIGLPLLQVLATSQLRAVIAHEFGHYHGGDTRLGPWLYRTRAAIGRTLNAVGDAWLQKPFEWYGNLFLRVTHAVSRQQEIAADALAARVAGARPLAEGLRTVHAAGQAFGAYWGQEVLPVLRAGFRPPLADGFRRFVSAPGVAAVTAAIAEQATAATTGDPYDTHPPLAARLAALKGQPEGGGAAADPPAIELLEDVPALEQRLLEHLVGGEGARELAMIDWDQAPARVWLPRWRAAVAAEAAAVAGVTAGTLPAAVADLDAHAARLHHHEGESDDDRQNRALAILATALGVALAADGSDVRGAPGEPVTLALRDGPLDPFALLPTLADPESARSWLQRCRQLGIADLPLDVVASGPRRLRAAPISGAQFPLAPRRGSARS